MRLVRDGEDAAQRRAAFEHLQMLVEDIDHAVSMENLGLWPDVLAQATHSDAELRMYAFWVLASASQLNPKVQEAMLRHGALGLAFTALETDAAQPVRAKALLLISAVVRQSTPAFIVFTKIDGLRRLQAVVDGDDAALSGRACFFLGHLFEERPRLQKESPALYAKVALPPAEDAA